MKKINYLLLAMLIALTSCNKMENGIVVSKEYEPKEVNYMFLPMTISNGKSVTTILVPYVIYDDPDFILHIKGKVGDKEVTKAFYVDETYYNIKKIGDLVYIDEHYNVTDFNNRKVRQ